MMRSFFAAAVLTVALASSASADFVFTTIGTSGSPSIAGGDFLATGRNISSGGSTGIPVQQDAMKFTAPNDYTLSSYQLALLSNTGTTGGTLQISLIADNGNAPDFGNIIETVFANSNNATEQVVTAPSSGATVLTGVSYWLYASMNVPNQAIVWAEGNRNINGASGPISGQVYTNPPVTVATGNLSGFRIQGALIPPVGVPEPSSFALVALGVLGMGGWGWHRQAKKAVATTV